MRETIVSGIYCLFSVTITYVKFQIIHIAEVYSQSHSSVHFLKGYIFQVLVCIISLLSMWYVEYVPGTQKK